MFSRINLTLVLGFAVAALLLATPASANLLTNGGFDTQSTACNTRATTDGYHDTYASNGDLPGWTSSGTGTSSGLEMLTYGPNTGNQGGLPGNKGQSGVNTFGIYWRFNYSNVLSQAFAVQAGDTYSLSLWSGVQSGNGGNYNVTLTPSVGSLTGDTTGSPIVWSSFGPSGSALTGVVGPSGGGTWTGNYASGNGAWVNFTANFTPSVDATVTLLFNGGVCPSYTGACLDTVDVEQTGAPSPEPGTLALLAAGLAGLLCYAWRKRR